jgi:EAL domain-containing protein (putative c-di-GMP-specific phosphodiesterase class I)
MAGDEFTVLLPALAKGADAGAVAQRILDIVAAPFNIGGHELFVTCCIGIALYPADGTARDSILKAAAVSMRHAKRERRDSYRYFSKELNAQSLDRLSLETELRRAIERGELELFYQPKVDLKSNRLVGAEALVRWRHPQRGMVSPGDFIPLAEETGLIIPLGQWVLNTACQQVRTWEATGRQAPRVSVNVSSHQFRQRVLARDVQAALSGSGIAARHLCLELTESAIMEHAQDNVRTLAALKESGVSLSIDDFGTGYSSLSYLKRFPIDEIKIDRSFVSGVEREKDNAAIVTAIIVMAHSLGLRVVAEGVETPVELEYLQQQGCDECQGFLYSRPLPAADFGALLMAQSLPVLSPGKQISA